MNEHELPVIAGSVNPAIKRYGLTGVAFSQFAASVGSPETRHCRPFSLFFSPLNRDYTILCNDSQQSDKPRRRPVRRYIRSQRFEVSRPGRIGGDEASSWLDNLGPGACCDDNCPPAGRYRLLLFLSERQRHQSTGAKGL